MPNSNKSNLASNSVSFNKVSRRLVLGMGAAASFAPNIAFSDEYPSRTIRIMVGATPGGSIDFGARVIATALSGLLNTPVIVENKPGASGVLNSDYVAKAAPDGYTLMVGTPSPVIIAPQAMSKVAFNPLTDLTSINMVSSSPIAFAVNPKLPVHKLSELVALTKQRPVSMGLPLAGSLSHLVVEIVAKAAGCSFTNVPYKGAGPANNDVIAGHVDATVSDAGVFLPFHKENRMRIVMLTSEKRLSLLPDVPTANEDYPGLMITNWIGLFGPAKMPEAIVEKINMALQKMITLPEVRAQFARSIVTPVSLPSTQAFQSFVAAEYQRYGQILRERNITIS
jgi:tripartite-type tricarboxylate transporter receptor subunit TctC